MKIIYTKKHLDNFQALKVVRNNLKIGGEFDTLKLANCIMFDNDIDHITYYFNSGKMVSYKHLS